MTLLITYVLIALVFSFLCSIAEAVILSVTTSYIAVLEKNGKPSGKLLRKLKEDINSSLAAILTLNTIAHTVGAAGAGAQAAVVFGSAYLGVASAILTFLILVFSEIIPKTLGAHYWQKLAPATAYCLRILIIILYPLVKMSEKLTKSLAQGPTLTGFSREEFAAMAELGRKQGLLASKESNILKGLLTLDRTNIKSAMTPRTVMFTLSEQARVGEYYERHGSERFSRIPVYTDDKEQITGFVLRNDLLLAQAAGDSTKLISEYRREIHTLSNSVTLSKAFDEMLKRRAHIVLVVDEYGGIEGILSLEDIFETLLGEEIVDEGDKITDMQQLARRFWRRRAQRIGLKSDASTESDDHE